MTTSLSKRVRVPLAHPVDYAGHRYTDLRVRRAKPKDLAGLRAGISLEAKFECGVSIAARLCGVPEAVIYALDPSDAERVGRTVDELISKVV